MQRYVEEFDTVELNGSFYRWPRDSTWTGWRDQLPPGFRFTVKAPRGLTHARQLRAPEAWIDRIGKVWQVLGDRAGVLLVQLPPGLPRDDDLLTAFLAHLPDGIRTAVEFRHPSWEDEHVMALLEQYRAAYCVMSGAQLPCRLRRTADFVYVRLHGPDPQTLYAGSYSEDDLNWWADRTGEWAAGGADVYVYFNNDGYAHAVRNAWALRALIDEAAR